ncbi:MAG TPA: glutathione S-transferase N-terminal domain-containing protein [Caulobacterales bacterium]|nr:glutathione S-transferase N-terminal domain-containing protein [Caulobacterales bacterium]
MPPIEVFFWPTPNGHKMTIALEEMGLPYVFRMVNINVGAQRSEDYTRLNPNNRMPTVVDPEGPDGRPITIFESGAILQYLGEKSGKLYPRDWRARVEVDQWLFWQVSALGPFAGQVEHFRDYAPRKVSDPAQLAYALDRYTKEVDRLYRVLERGLKGRDFIAGEFSIADAAIWPWLRGSYQQSFEGLPRLAAYFERVHARPAVQKALAIGAAARARGVRGEDFVDPATLDLVKKHS